MPHFEVMRYENQQFGVANPHKMQKRSYPPSFSPIGWKLRFYYFWGNFSLLCPILGSCGMKISNFGSPILIICSKLRLVRISSKSAEKWPRRTHFDVHSFSWSSPNFFKTHRCERKKFKETCKVDEFHWKLTNVSPKGCKNEEKPC